MIIKAFCVVTVHFEKTEGEPWLKFRQAVLREGRKVEDLLGVWWRLRDGCHPHNSENG